VLGPLRIALDECPLTAFESDKVRALLIYLALEAERPQRRTTLAEMFWPDQPERVARHNLSQALFNLRQTIGDQAAQPPFLLINRDTVQFNCASDHSVDAATFAKLIAACDAHQHRRLHNCVTCAGRLAAALDLYRGDFLAQFSLADSAAFEEWSLLKRERFRQVALQALSTLATYHELRDDYGRARDLALRQLELDAWSEIAYRQLMRALTLLGQRPAALAAYDRCREVLADQLNVEPDVETTALAEEIRAAEGDLPFQKAQSVLLSTRPNNLPAQLTAFVGREHELVQIGDLLVNPQCRLITIFGPGGIGKTRLALQAGLEQVETFADGVFWVSLAHLHEPGLVPTTIAHALDLTLAGADEPRTQLVRYLRSKELLLLLDNFEHLLDGAPWLSDLLRAAPGVTLLVTSRERLDLHAEWLVEVGGLTLPDEQGAEIEQSSAGQLWVQTAQRVQVGYAVAQADRACVAQVCRMVEGMPLAIELAAAWVRELGCKEIVEEITKGLALLRTTARDVPQRHRSFRAVLDHSWNLLNLDEQRVLRQLAVFRGGFEHDAASQVAGASIEHLAALVDKSLLRGTAQSANQRRYDLHEIVRQYAFDQLKAAAEMEQVRDGHLQYFLSLAEQAAPHLIGAEQGRWLLRLEVEHGNFRFALDWALQRGEAETAARICGAIWRFWQTRGYLAEGREWIARALNLADHKRSVWNGWGDAANSAVTTHRSVNKSVLAQVLKGAGVLAWMQSDYAEATTSFETSLAFYQELDDKDGIAAVSGNLGVLALYQGDYEQASGLFQMALELRRELGDKWGTAVCLQNLGAMAGKRGDPTLAQAYYEEGLALYRELGHERGIAALLGNLGDVAGDRGDFQRARRFAMESLALLRKLGDEAGTATALTRLGLLALRRNDMASARSYYAESLPLLRALGDKEYLAMCLEGFAAIAVAQQQWERAACLWGAAEALRNTINVPLPPHLRSEYEHRLTVAHMHLDEPMFGQAWEQGQAMSEAQAVTYALDMHSIEAR